MSADAKNQAPDGYHLTEIGVIPEDWQVVNIRSICDISVGKDINPNYSPESDSKYCFPVFSNTVDIPGIYGYYNYPEYSGDVVTVVGRGVGLGTAICRSGGFGAIGRLLVLFPKKEVNNLFLENYINNRIDVFSESSGVPQLTGIALGNYSVACPPPEEQTAIANALSDVDALITSLEKLIAKKRAIKTAAMQQLLTGKKRLPPFDQTHTGYKQTELGEIPEDWEMREIREVAKVRGGKRLPKGEQLLKSPTKNPYIRVADMFVGGVDLTDIRYVPENVAPIIQNYRIKTTDLFISVAGTLGIVGKIPIILDGANLTENANKITEISVNSDYLLFWLMTEKIQNEIASQSTMGAQPKLALGRIEGFQVAFPKELEEQTAIAQVLSEVEKEIDALVQRLKKTQQLKQGMMQELLTGRTRLV